MKKLLAVFLSLTMILALSACTSDTEKELYGIWTVEDVTFSNSSLVTEYELAAFETTYKETVLKLNEDKTGTLRYIGKDYDISWQLEEHTNLLIFIDGLLFTEIGVFDEGLALPVDTDKVFICVNLIKNNEYIDETIISDNADSSTTAIQPKPDMLIDTEYYTVSAPNSWNDDCFYEIADGENYNYTLSFYDKASHEAINGGWLFSINLLTEFEDYSNYPDYDVLGSLEVYRIGSYNIVVTYPTDVQCSEETAEKYREMCDDISHILNTIAFKDECTFSEEPIPVEKDTTATEVSERYLGRWEDLYIGKGMKFDDYVWNVEFRSDGTGTFEFVYGANDIEYLDFTFSTFLPRDNGHMEGVSIYNDFGEELKFYVTCTWSNELQTGVMTLQDWENPDLYWTFKLVTQ